MNTGLDLMERRRVPPLAMVAFDAMAEARLWQSGIHKKKNLGWAYGGSQTPEMDCPNCGAVVLHVHDTMATVASV